jgi:putative nucleotidyltransferase with HDIG domain
MKSLENRLSEWIFDTDIFKNKDIYLVGGSVRDIILNRKAQDIDLVCENARQMAQSLAQEKHAVCVVMDKKPDVPCFRLINRKSPENFIDITEIRGNSIESDLNQRDFTINALAIPLKSKHLDSSQIIDVVSGQADMTKKLIRMVSPQSFIDDPLRMLRAFRFSAQLSFEIDANTMSHIQKNAHRIVSISAERILFELKLLFRHPDTYHFIEKMDQTGLLCNIFPEIESLRTCRQNDYHHTHVWGHSLETLQAYEQIISQLNEWLTTTDDLVHKYLDQNDNLAMIKLACLFHDIAKPMTQKQDPETQHISFYRHDKLGKNEIEKICDRLRLSKKNAAFVCTLVEEHLHIRDLLHPNTRRNTLLKSCRQLGETIIAVGLLSIADKLASRGLKSQEADRAAYQDTVFHFIESFYNEIQPAICTKNLITGKHLMEIGIEPGPTMGKILRMIRLAQDEGKISTSEQALELARTFKMNNH